VRRAPVKTVLLADHHPPTLEHLREALIQAGYTVRATSDPGKAMEHVLAEPLDAVLVSIDFPPLSGQHLIQLVRAHDQVRRVPVLAMDHGHLGRPRGVGAILDLKANAYVADPTKVPDLRAKLAALLAGSMHARAQVSGGVQAVLSRPPISTGALKALPLPQLLHSFYRLRREGILVVAWRDLTRRVYFLEGAPVSYDSSERPDSLPSFLLEKGEITEEQSHAVTRSMASGMRISTALADAGVALGGDDLLARLRDYILEKTAQVVGMRDGRYAFYSGTEFTPEVAKIDVPALAPILEGARRSFPLKVFVQPLRMHGGEFPTRTPAFGQDLPALGLDTGDLKIAMQMNGRIPLRELVAHGRGELRETCSLLWYLVLCGGAELSPKPAAAGEQEAAYAASERIAPRKRKPLPADKLAELRDAAVKILTGSYFQVLGLDITADTEAVEKAFQEVGIRFHPDTYAEWDCSEIHDVLDSVQDKLSGAYRVLSVEEKRRSYVQFVASRAGARAAPVHVGAEIAAKRGELAMKRKDFITARLAFEEATSLNAREPEYYPFLAWATFLGGKGDRAERARAAQKVVKKALALNPNLETVQIISAIVDSDQGDGTAAHRKLIRVLEANPASRLAKAALRKAHR
jgi:DNA-binding NarL/FixJ family response regulator/tetratricopeptide (TPR) repeat protein